MGLKKREKRVVDAFINCIIHGEFDVYYTDLRIYDKASYGWMSDAAFDYYEEQTAQFREVEEG